MSKNYMELFSRYDTSKNCCMEETENYLHCLLQVCGDWGCPRAIRTDNDKEFTSNLCDKLNALLNVKRSVTIPWNPSGNSIVERANKELIHKLTLIIYHHEGFQRVIKVLGGFFPTSARRARLPRVVPPTPV